MRKSVACTVLLSIIVFKSNLEISQLISTVLMLIFHFKCYMLQKQQF